MNIGQTPRRRMVFAAMAASLGVSLPIVAWGQGKTKAAAPAAASDPTEGDPLKTHIWPDIRREFLGVNAKVVFDSKVEVLGPAFAEDPMNVPISFKVRDLPGVSRIVVIVDRNPIRKVLEYQPVNALPALSFRFKLEQASAVRVAALATDGIWHVGHTLVDSAGGGCTVSGASRNDGSWAKTLGQGSGKVFAASAHDGGGSASNASSQASGDAAARLRLRVMHPMDTGLVAGVPAFYVSKLSVRDGDQRELARLLTYEPVSENPVFSFDFAKPPKGPLAINGVDNNGNRVALKVASATP
jgi:sulfur-oxidizing protein SoxY